MRRLTGLIGSALVLLALPGCSPRYRIAESRLQTPPTWPFARGDLAGTGAVTNGKEFNGLAVMWTKKQGDKPAGPLTIYHGSLVYPGTRKKVRFFDLVTGKPQGVFKAKGVPQTAVVMHEATAFYALAPKRNRVYAIDLKKRKRLWKGHIKDAAPGPIIVNDRLIISSAGGTLSAFELAGREPVWTFSGEGRFVASAVFGDNKLFQPSDKGVLYALDPVDGHKEYEVPLDGPLVSSPAVAGQVFVASMPGRLYAVDPTDGTIIWQAILGGPAWCSPSVANGKVFVGHSGGEVVCFDALTGRQLWKVETEEVVKAAPLWINHRLVVGTMAGTILLLDADTGEEMAREKVTGAIKFPPVSDGERVYVATQSGRIVCFGDQK